MRRTASQVLRQLEARVARLEGRTANSYLQQISNALIAKGDIVIDTITDKYNEVKGDIEDYTPASGFIYGAWFLTNKDHGSFQEWAETSNVGSYLVYDGRTWKAGIVWTGMELSDLDDLDDPALDAAERYFDRKRALTYQATGDVSKDLRGIRAMISKV